MFLCNYNFFSELTATGWYITCNDKFLEFFHWVPQNFCLKKIYKRFIDFYFIIKSFEISICDHKNNLELFLLTVPGCGIYHYSSANQSWTKDCRQIYRNKGALTQIPLPLIVCVRIKIIPGKCHILNPKNSQVISQ